MSSVTTVETVAPPVRTRLLGLDAARFVALIGMFAIHVLPLETADGRPTVTELVAGGRSAALFGVLAGVSVALATGGVQRPAAGRAHRAAAAGLAVRGLLIGLLGLGLIEIGTPAIVILPFYAVLFVLAGALVRLTPRVLAGCAAVACVVTPVISFLLRPGPLPDGSVEPTVATLAAPGEFFTILFVTGTYPVLTWITFLLAGMAIGRCDLWARATAVRLIVGGVALAVVAKIGSLVLLAAGGAEAIGDDGLERLLLGVTPTDTWWWLAVDSSHSGTSFFLAGSVGTSMAVLGAMLLLARWSERLVWVPAAVGSMPLTMYTMQLLVLDATDPIPAIWTWVGYVIGAVALGVGLRWTGQRGPLEAVVGGVSSAARRAVENPYGRHAIDVGGLPRR
ncbi:heparan-alpha-glucosaminide N-acetyltransferase domain-containing protein [Pseudonocardia sp. TRM90224]|uniref:heparan-alpha-glucosaminide N-acetyltransferase domain-containing protein n=1 Tax=Pseudonocardia sp. TRM90224 TaxID=2812678 RepID=UPI001E409FD4|nr:heparan-alpha-glucosaminide N-acetyltransferase domain-containing protein [Pseudonocardia sp. TRM90224]